MLRSRVMAVHLSSYSFGFLQEFGWTGSNSYLPYLSVPVALQFFRAYGHEKVQPGYSCFFAQAFNALSDHGVQQRACTAGWRPVRGKVGNIIIVQRVIIRLDDHSPSASLCEANLGE